MANELTFLAWSRTSIGVMASVSMTCRPEHWQVFTNCNLCERFEKLRVVVYYSS